MTSKQTKGEDRPSYSYQMPAYATAQVEIEVWSEKRVIALMLARSVLLSTPVKNQDEKIEENEMQTKKRRGEGEKPRKDAHTFSSAGRVRAPREDEARCPSESGIV